jgi:hypothetical protein
MFTENERYVNVQYKHSDTFEIIDTNTSQAAQENEDGSIQRYGTFISSYWSFTLNVPSQYFVSQKQTPVNECK